MQVRDLADKVDKFCLFTPEAENPEAAQRKTDKIRRMALEAADGIAEDASPSDLQPSQASEQLELCAEASREEDQYVPGCRIKL